MWFSYLLTEYQLLSKQIQTETNFQQWKVNIEILASCFKKQILKSNKKSTIPYVITSNLKVKIEEQHFSNEIHSLSFSQQKQIQNCKQASPLNIISAKKIKKQQKIKKIKKKPKCKAQRAKNPGRNSTSNIFRVFLKLCSKLNSECIIKGKFQQAIKNSKSIISFQQFRRQINQLAPSTSNYVNFKEFCKIWRGQCQFNKIFRILFHWFVNNFGIVHSLTLKGKHKMMRESVLHFLKNLRQIEQQLGQMQKQKYTEDSLQDSEQQLDQQ